MFLSMKNTGFAQEGIMRKCNSYDEKIEKLHINGGRTSTLN